MQHAAFVEANKHYEELLLDTPESYPFPFGEYEGKRLDEVQESLIRWATNPSRSDASWVSRLSVRNVYAHFTRRSTKTW